MIVLYNSGKKQRITCSSTCVSPCATTPTRSRNSSSDHSQPASCPPASTKRSDDTPGMRCQAFWHQNGHQILQENKHPLAVKHGQGSNGPIKRDSTSSWLNLLRRSREEHRLATQLRRPPSNSMSDPIPLLSPRKRSRASNGRRAVATHSMLTSHACAYRHNHIRSSSSSSSSSFFLSYIHIYRQTKHPHPHLIYRPDESHPLANRSL